MTNKNKRNRNEVFDAVGPQSTNADRKNENALNQSSTPEIRRLNSTNLIFYLKSNLWLIGILGFLALGTLGAGLKYLDEEAQRELARRAADKGRQTVEPESFLNQINPFLPAAAPIPISRPAKEYIYAGSRMLAIEDADAAPVPPADLAVWRPSSGAWYVFGGVGSQQFVQSFGLAEDIPAPGDYDGDGKTDLCIFRSSTGAWWILKSSDNNHYSVLFGMSGDKPAAADYDGDGKTDIAVFRPSSGTWYVHQSSNQIAAQATFGLSSDRPTPADFDGDGRADIAVWRSSNSTFYSMSSSDLQTAAYAFAQSNGSPVPADYDGDGRADYAIRSGAEWIIHNSSSNQLQTVNWQQSTDLAVQNDYDGDGKVDIAVWRDSNGSWYIRQSASGGALRQQAWGTSGDIPVPAFYHR